MFLKLILSYVIFIIILKVIIAIILQYFIIIRNIILMLRANMYINGNSLTKVSTFY